MTDATLFGEIADLGQNEQTTPTNTPEISSDPQSGDAQMDAGAEAKAPKATARTRSRSKRAVPAADGSGATDVSPDATDGVEAITTTRSATRRTRSTRKPATPAPAPEPETELDQPVPAPVEQGEQAQDEPVALAPVTRVRRSRRATAPTTSASSTMDVVSNDATAASIDAPAMSLPVVPTVPEVVAGGDADAESEVTDELELMPELEQMTRIGAAPRLATTAVLFQAPDPAMRPRRRRAESPAGPPRHPDKDEQRAVANVHLEESAQEPDEQDDVQDAAEHQDGETGARRRRRRGGRGRRGRSGGGDQVDGQPDAGSDVQDDDAHGDRDVDSEDEDVAGTDAGQAELLDGEGEGGSSSSRRRRRRRRSRGEGGEEAVAVETRPRARARTNEVTALKGSTRLEAKRQRRREGRDAGRRRTIITEAEFLARREAVERTMVVRETDGRVQIGIVEDGVLVEHYVSRSAQNSQAPSAGNVYLGRVQNVLPSMEAAFVDIGKGRNAVLYAGEVNWDAAGLEGQPRRIEQALKSGDPVLVQVTKEPVGHKGARLTSQVTLAGRYLVYVPGGGMTGISRKLPDNERARLKKILKEIVPDDAGVIVRTAAEGASDEELRHDVQRLQDQWTAIEKKSTTATAPALLQGEPDLAIRVVRDVFNDDFTSLVVQGEEAWSTVSDYVAAMAPDLADKVSRWVGDGDVFAAHRIDEQLAKGMDRKVWLPSGGSLVIDRTEAMTVIDVNTGKFTGSGGTLEETVTRNNLEAAEEIVRQLRLRDIGGIIVIDFIDMVLESNRDLVLRRLIECLGRDRTKHQVAEVTSLGLVQMTRKRVGQGLFEAFSEQCQQCNGRGVIVHSEPVDIGPSGEASAGKAGEPEPKKARRKKAAAAAVAAVAVPVLSEAREAVKATLATIAAAAAHAHEHRLDEEQGGAHEDIGADESPGTDTPIDAPVESPDDGARGDGAPEQDAPVQIEIAWADVAPTSSVPAGGDCGPEADVADEGEETWGDVTVVEVTAEADAALWDETQAASDGVEYES